MSLFNNLAPADTDAIKNGAADIRSTKGILNSLLGQIFADDLTFLAGFVTNTLLSGSADDDDDAIRAVGANNIKLAALVLSKFPDGVFTADAPGRAKFASGFVNTDLLNPAIVFPDGSVTQNAIAAQAVGTAELEDVAATIPKVGAGVAKIAIGAYSGSNSAAAAVTGLAFAPDVIILLGGKTSNRVGIAFRSEATSLIGPVHSTWDNGNVASPNTTAITWAADGFTVTPSNFSFNTSGANHAYLAFKV